MKPDQKKFSIIEVIAESFKSIKGTRASVFVPILTSPIMIFLIIFILTAQDLVMNSILKPYLDTGITSILIAFYLILICLTIPIILSICSGIVMNSLSHLRGEKIYISTVFYYIKKTPKILMLYAINFILRYITVTTIGFIFLIPGKIFHVEFLKHLGIPTFSIILTLSALQFFSILFLLDKKQGILKSISSSFKLSLKHLSKVCVSFLIIQIIILLTFSPIIIVFFTKQTIFLVIGLMISITSLWWTIPVIPLIKANMYKKLCELYPNI